MPFARASGILLHPTSLAGRGGIGDFGPAAYGFADFLAAAKQGVWQVLPLGPLGFGNSPYSSTSAFAGNPLLISLERLAERGWIERAQIDALTSGAEQDGDDERREKKKPPQSPVKRLWLSGLCVWAGWGLGRLAGKQGWRPAAPQPLPIARTEGTPAGPDPGDPRPAGPNRSTRGHGALVELRPPSALRRRPDLRPVPRGKLLDDPPGLVIEPADRKADATTLPAAPVPVEQGPAASTEKLPKLPSPGPSAPAGPRSCPR